MTPDEFREAGHRLIDWIADFRSGIEALPVRAQVQPGEVRSRFDVEPPDATVPFEELLAELDSAIIPGVTQVQHPMHFGWFPSNASLSSVLGDLASSGIGSLGISWESSPALTEVEEVVCDWMRQLVGLSDRWVGVINDTASTSALVALLIARERASDLSQNSAGAQGIAKPLVVYTSSEAHSSVAKAALLAGYGWSNIRTVDVDPHTRAMVPEHLDKAIHADRIAGRLPAAVVATVGSTSTTAVDPVAAITEVARRHSAFVHVDAALAGSAMLLPEMRHLWDGVEAADSITWNPHKWMGSVLDTSLFYVRDPEFLQRVMSTNPSYLQSPHHVDVTQYRDWGIPLGRRFRALKILFQLRLDGIEAIRARLRRDLENARWLASRVEQAPAWELCAPVTLQTVCVRHAPTGVEGADLDRHTLTWVRAINRSGEAFLTPSKIDDRWIARVSVGVESTERVHVERLWAIMAETAGSLS